MKIEELSIADLAAILELSYNEMIAASPREEGLLFKKQLGDKDKYEKYKLIHNKVVRELDKRFEEL